jgi:IS4 transposase
VLRRISYIDPETELWLIFLTNQFALDALTIALIYQHRWKIELFFRWIKQHLRLRGFFSTNANGVRVQSVDQEDVPADFRPPLAFATQDPDLRLR